MKRVIVGLLACAALAAHGQNLASPQVRPTSQPEQDLARKILATVESDASSASPDVRAFVWMRLATGLENDKQKQRKLFEDAYLSTLEIPVIRYNTRGQLQGEILYPMMAESGPDALEAVMPRADDYSRYIMRDLLIKRYAEDGNFDRALTLLQGAPDQSMYPFDAAEILMAKLPPERAGTRRTIFAQALTIASRNDSFMTVASMVGKFWHDLPSSQVLLVIDKVLQSARQQDSCPTLTKTNMYPYYVDQFLPILRELDSAKASRLTQEKEKAKTNGLPEEKCDYSKMFAARPTPTPDKNATPTPTPAPMQVRRHAFPPKPRVVFGCAGMGFCREQQIEHVLRAINGHLKRNEIEAAKREIGVAFAMAAAEWKYDTDEDDPNLWPRDMWPSTENWEAFTILASYISPQYALDQIKQIPDSGIRLITRQMLAQYWLGRDPDLHPPNIANDEGQGCECVPHYMYIPRHWGEKMP